MQYEQDELRRLQLVELGILRDVDKVCREHDIGYFMDSGTLLGAVRHGGFIPWDDDVDLGMMRSDYERFLEIAPRALGDSYVVCEPRSCPEFAGMFAKVWRSGTKFSTNETIEAGIDQGIFVDIFPYDVLHADPAVAAKQLRWCRLWQSASYLLHSRHITVPHEGVVGALEKMACTVMHAGARIALSHDAIVRSFESWAKRGSEHPGRSYMNMSYVTASAFSEDVLAVGSELLFEGVPFPAPSDAETYLETMYGSNWCKLPPMEARRNHAPVVLDFGDEQVIQER